MGAAEYSYFRAEGRSLQAVETADRSQKELVQMMRDLCSRIGAKDMLLDRDKAGDLFIDYFSFKTDEAVPEGWIVNNRQTDSKKKLVAVFAKPTPGSVDADHLKKISTKMNIPGRKARLENLFGCGEMPLKFISSGEYRDSFVRYTSNKYSWDGQGCGSLKDNVTLRTSFNDSARIPDPLDYMKMEERWYIRVPNTSEGRPVYSPPDAVHVSYFDMLQIDRRENEIRQVIARNGMGFNGPEPR